MEAVQTNQRVSIFTVINFDMAQSLSSNFKFFQSVGEIPPKHWDEILSPTQVFLTLSYLNALEKTLAETIKPVYIIVYDSNNRPMLCGLFQIATFTYKKVGQPKSWYKLFQECRNADDSYSINGLVCGNIFATGENGFAYTPRITKRAALDLLASVAKGITEDSRWESMFSIILFKEFWPESLTQTYILEDHKYRPFQVDVNMVLPIHTSWKTFGDYLKSMKAKYRTKAKSASKKGKVLSIRSLSSLEIKKEETTIQRLFSNVLNKSYYSYGENYPLSFSALKENLGELFICKGVFLNDTLIAFSTAFKNGHNLEANYVGIDYRYNTEYAVYERLLYDYVQEAIEQKVSALHLGRTSELIKSAVGAVPVGMTLYARHTSKIKNALLKPVLENLKPSEFQLRKPFVKGFRNTEKN